MTELRDIFFRLFVAVSFLLSAFLFFSGIYVITVNQKGMGLGLVFVSVPLYFSVTRGARWILSGEKVGLEEIRSFFHLSSLAEALQNLLLIPSRVLKSLAKFFKELNIIIPKTFRGEYSLGQTYWFGAVLGGLVIALVAIFPMSFLSAKVIFTNPALSSILGYGSLILALAVQIFFLISVNNSASKDRARGFWGWLAVLVLTLGTVQIVWSLIGASGLRDVSWSELVDGIRQENLALPIRVDEITTLRKMETNWQDRSLTYKFEVELDGLNERDFSFVLENRCPEINHLFESGAKLIIYDYSGEDGSGNSVQIAADDC